MSFDNADFERNAKTTMSTLDKLKKTLDFSGTSESLSSISSAASKVDMSPLQNGVQEVHSRFSALEIFAISALANIANRAVDAGFRITKALSLDSIMSGFSEYELMMNSVQTIMSGTGESLDTVMGKLSELNQYADDTIYVFSDMTQNIGKFTNAGVSLDVAVAAMKGLSNEAALSGASAMEASRAMYNISQALSMGYMQYIDWKSIENANMATKEFKENLVATALEMGTLTEETVAAQPSLNALFKDMLKDGWLTNDVLLTTLGKYSDETTDLGKRAYAAARDIKTFSQMWDTLTEAAGSGWAQTFQYIIGDFDQAKKLWTSVGGYFDNIIQSSANARNELFKGWNETGGRDDLIAALGSIGTVFVDTLGTFTGAFKDVFGNIDVKSLDAMSKSFKEFATTLKDGIEPILPGLRDTFRGFFSVVDIGVNVITSLARAFWYLVSNSGIADLAKSIFGLSGSFGDYISNVDNTIKKNDTLYKAFKKVADFLLLIPKGINTAFEALTGMGVTDAIDKLTEALTNMFSSVEKGTSHFKDFTGEIGNGLSSKIDTLKEAFAGLGTETGLLQLIFEGTAKGLSTVASTVIDILTTITKAITSTFGEADTGDMMAFLNTAGLAGTFTAFLTKLTNLLDPLDDIGDMITNVREDLAILQNAVKADIIKKIAESVAILAVSCLLLSTIDADKLAAPFAVITGFTTELTLALGAINKFSPVADTFGGAFKGLINAAAQTAQARALVTMSEAVLVLSLALKAISTIEPDRLVSSMVAITVLLGELVGAAILLNQFGGKIKTGGFIAMATSLLVLSAALKVISSIEPEQLLNAVLALTIALSELTGSLMILSNMNVSGMMAGAAAMLLVSNALLVMTASIAILGSMDLNTLGQGLLGMLGGLAIITTALTALSMMSPVGLLAGAAALTVASGAVVILSSAVALLGTMSPEGTAIALIALSGSLTALAVAMAFMQTALPGAAALIVAAGAIAILAPSLMLLSTIPFTTLLTSLAGLALTIGLLAGAAVLLSPILPLMAGLSGVLVLFGAACTLVGVGVLALATGLATLAVSGVAGATAFVGVLSVILGAIPMIVTAIALFVETLLNAYISLMPLIIQAVVTTIEGICSALVTCVPTLLSTAMTLILSLLTTIRDNIKPIVEIGADIVINLMQGIAEKLPELIDTAFTVIISFIDGLGEAIENHAADIRDAMIRFAEHLWNAFCEFFGIHSPSTKMNEGGTFLIQGLIDGIGSMISSVKNKIGELKDAVLGKLKEKLSDFIDKGKDMMDKVKSGLEDKREALKEKISSIGDSIKGGLTDKYESLKEAGSYLMEGLKNGLSSMAESVKNKAGEIGSNVISKLKSVFDIHSPSKVTTGMGQFLDQGLINGMQNLRAKTANAAANVANSVIDALLNNISDINDEIDDEFHFTPIVKPVLDLSGIQNGVSRVSDLLNDYDYDTILSVKEARESRRSDPERVSARGNTVINNVEINQTNESPEPIDTYQMYKNNKKLVEMIKGATT